MTDLCSDCHRSPIATTCTLMEPQGIVYLRSCRSFSTAFGIPRHRSRLSTECERDSVCVCEWVFEWKAPREAWTEKQVPTCAVESCMGEEVDGTYQDEFSIVHRSLLGLALPVARHVGSLSLKIRNERLWTCGWYLVEAWEKNSKKALFCDRCLSVDRGYGENLC